MIDIHQPMEWRTTPLGEVTGFQNGYAFKSSTYRDDGAFVIRIGNVQAHGISLNNPAYVDPAVLGAENFFLCEGDLLISLTGNVGRVAVIRKEHLPAVLNQRVARVQPAGSVEKGFLFHLMRSEQVQRKIFECAKGAAQLNISTKDLARIEVPLPPLAEQKVIADKLDTLLAQVENTKARLERIPQILKRFRQSVLAAAVSGRLTEEWREDSSYNDEGFPDSWTFKHLSEVGQLARGKSKHRPRNDPRLFGEEYPFIQTGEVANATGEITSATRFYSAFGLEQSRLFPAGTLCITIAANIADTAILGIDACFPDSVVGFTPKDSEALAYFVKFLIDVNKQDLESFAPATAQKNINLKVLNELRLPFPSLEEQTEIVRRVDQLFAHADSIEHQVNNALARVNNLTQSILAKAFRGELTEQWRKDNPELISGENSAEALLERIKAEPAAAKPAKKTRKKMSS